LQALAQCRVFLWAYSSSFFSSWLLLPCTQSVSVVCTPQTKDTSILSLSTSMIFSGSSVVACVGAETSEIMHSVITSLGVASACTSQTFMTQRETKYAQKENH
jgi:hypothetical protein